MQAIKLKQLLAESFQDANGNQELHEAMKVIHSASWSYDRDYRNDHHTKFAVHFSCTLSMAGFDATKAMTAWQMQIIRVKVAELWKNVFEYKRNEYPNLCLCTEIIFSLSRANSTVERAFSTLRLLLSDGRLGMRHSWMEQLLIICSDDKHWSAEE